MKLSYCIFLAVVGGIVLSTNLLAQGFECDGRFFISLTDAKVSDGPSNTDLFKIDFGQSSVDFTDEINFSGIEFNGIGYNPQDNFIYGINRFLNDQGGHDIVRLSSDGNYEVLPLGDGKINEIAWHYGAADCSPEGYFVVYDRVTQQLHYLNVAGERVTLHKSLSLKWAPEVGAAAFYVAMDDFAFDVSGDGAIYSYQRNHDLDPKESEETRGALLKIDGDLNSATAGTVSIVGQPDPTIFVHMGAMFFSTTGELYGYASSTPLKPNPPGLTHDRLVAINKLTAETRLLETGPVAHSNDGCSCPFTLGMRMQATSTPTSCQSTVDYTVTITNNAADVVSGIAFTDTLPDGMTIVALSSLEKIPHEIADGTGIGFGVLTLDNMSLPANVAVTFTIHAASRGLSGTFEHQAYLIDLPASLGSTIVSDDTTTVAPYDPTVVTITEEIPALELVKDTLVCEGEPVKLSAVVDPAWSYYWTNSDGFYSEESNPTVTVPAGQDSAYYYVHQQKENCELVDSLLISISPAPALALVADTTIVLGTAIPLAPSLVEDSNLIYQWSPTEGLSCTDCANPQATPTTTTEYELLVSNPSGCTSAESVVVEVIEQKSEPREEAYVPNAFSPNNDRLNDVFYPVAAPTTTCQLLEIYNRWGELVFKNSNFSPNDATCGWDGTYRGQLASAGTYLYRLVVDIEAGQQKEYQGTLHLIR